MPQILCVFIAWFFIHCTIMKHLRVITFAVHPTCDYCCLAHSVKCGRYTESDICTNLRWLHMITCLMLWYSALTLVFYQFQLLAEFVLTFILCIQRMRVHSKCDMVGKQFHCILSQCGRTELHLCQQHYQVWTRGVCQHTQTLYGDGKHSWTSNSHSTPVSIQMGN